MATARPLPPAIRERIGKLLLLLSSPLDSERAGAATAIERVLTANGFDWHDLTAAITTPTLSPSPRPASPPPRPTPPRPSSVRQDSKSMPGDELAELIETLRDRRRFDPDSEDFLESLAARADRYSSVYLSPKQLKWLRDLARKAGL